jgi:hypothetical protein
MNFKHLYYNVFIEYKSRIYEVSLNNYLNWREYIFIYKI